MAECPYEKREDNGGKLVRKSVTNSSPKPFAEQNARYSKKKPSKIVLVAREEYPDDKEEETEKETSHVSAMAILKTATTTTPSLFDSPNNDLLPKGNKGICFMAKAIETASTSVDNYTPTDIDVESLKVKLEAITMDEFLSNLQGEARIHVESLVA